MARLLTNAGTCLLMFSVSYIAAAEQSARPSDSTRLPAADSHGVEANRVGNELILELSDTVRDSVTVPRLAAALRTIEWIGASEATSGISLKPEPNEWLLAWQQRPRGATGIRLTFDSKPLLMSEVEPITSHGDGSFWLPAHLGKTSGEKIRYEPQTFKNTVGYWVGADDRVQWELQIDEPGRFNVGILQGCGSGQGGSQARIFLDSQSSNSQHELAFEVVETGHFQNFQWRHVGSLDIATPGRYTLSIAPIAIKRNALMDVRAVHLIRVP